MQQPDMRIAPLDDFTVHFDDQTKYTVRRRMLRPEIHREVFDLGFGHQSAFSALSSAFSSPGRMYFAPSQGLMKSKLRKSWVSLTGS